MMIYLVSDKEQEYRNSVYRDMYIIPLLTIKHQTRQPMKYDLSFYINAQGVLCVKLNEEEAHLVDGVKAYPIDRFEKHYVLIFI